MTPQDTPTDIRNKLKLVLRGYEGMARQRQDSAAFYADAAQQFASVKRLDQASDFQRLAAFEADKARAHLDKALAYSAALRLLT